MPLPEERWGPSQPHRQLLDDLLSLLQACLQAANELKVLRPGRPLPWLLSGIFQSVSSRHTMSPLLPSLRGRKTRWPCWGRHCVLRLASHSLIHERGSQGPGSLLRATRELAAELGVEPTTSTPSLTPDSFPQAAGLYSSQRSFKNQGCLGEARPLQNLSPTPRLC